MLRSIRDNAFVLSPRFPEPEALRAGLLTIIRFLLIAALAFAFSRATPARLHPMASLAPFAMALFAAGLSAEVKVAAMLAGCMAGALGRGLDSFNLSLPIGCAVILAGSLLWGLLEPFAGRLRAALCRDPAIQARSPNGRSVSRSGSGDAVAAAALAGLGVLVPGLIYAGGEMWPSAQALAAALAASAATPFMAPALRVRLQNRILLFEERAGLFLMACALAAGLYDLSAPLALGLSLGLAMLAAPAGSLLGLGTGAAILLVSKHTGCAAAMGCCGAVAELTGRLPRPARAGVTASAALAVAMFVGLPPAETAALCAAPPLAMLAPGPVREQLLRWTRKPAAACAPDRLAAILREQSARRLRAMSAAFDDLAEGYLTPASLPDEQALMARLREALCDGCPVYEGCWAGGENLGARLLCDLVGEAVQWSGTDMERALFDEGAPAELARRCRRGRQIPERVGGALSDFAILRRGELKRGGENRLISAQFLQAAQLIDAMAEEQSRPIRLRDRQARRAMGVLERGGISLSDALLVSGARTELILTLREERWTRPLAGRASALLNRAFGRVYAPEDAWGRTMRFVRQPRLEALTGAASVSRESGGPSGDHCVTAMLDEDRLLALICDGMGSGEAAARESGTAARLLGRFLSAGAGLPLAMETVNALMLNIAAEDMFSTVDLMLLDLSTGVAEFVKLAAPPTLIARDGETRRVEGGRLPLGILERVEPAVARVQLIPGDLVVMASDGVMDAAPPEALETLALSAGEDMNALCEQILSLSARAAQAHPDDMTALCVRLRERGLDE